MSTALQDHRIAAGSLRALVGSIETHIARGRLSRTGFGKAAPGDASLPGRLDRGSDARFGTADKVLACKNPEPIHPRFARGVEAFLGVTGIERHLLDKEAPGDSSFVLRLEKGQSPTLGTVDRANDWMADKARPAELEAVRSAVEDGAPAVPAVAAIHGEIWEMDGNICYIKTKEAAAQLGLSYRTLESYRSRGGGPPFYVLGTRMVRYLLSDVLKWASTRRRNSTSDDGLCSPAPEDEEHDCDEEEEDGDEDDNGDEEDEGADGPGEPRR